jgi:UDPglucose 6-dehydrogenase
MGEHVKISVIGCGYLGAVHAASMAELGHDVVGIDVDRPKVETLQQAKAPFYEPGFEDLLSSSLASGRLRFSTDIADARDAVVHFVCVGTPQKRGEYAADLRYVHRAGRHRRPAGRCRGRQGARRHAGLEPGVPP